MLQTDMMPMDMRVLAEQIYWYKKGVDSSGLISFLLISLLFYHSDYSIVTNNINVLFLK